MSRKRTVAKADSAAPAKQHKRSEFPELYCGQSDEILRLYAGMGYTLREAAQALKLPYGSLKKWAWEIGLHFKPVDPKVYTNHTVMWEGKEYSTADLARMHRMKRTTLSDRLRNGWDVDEALATPVRQGNYTPRQGRDREPAGDDARSLWLRRPWK